MPVCPHCAAATSRTSTDEKRLVAATMFVVRVPAHGCKRCRESFIQGEALARVELTIACELAARGPCSGETLRFMRKAVGYPATKLARLLDVAAETLSRWERDQRCVDLNAWLIVGSIVLEHAQAKPRVGTLERIASATRRSTRPRVMKLDLVAKRAAR